MSEPVRLGKYEIVATLGQGSMGVVYKAFDPGIHRTVALKTIRKELIDEQGAGQMLARFQNEARAAGRLSHPGIVAVYDYGDAGELAYIAMEFVQGSSLREYFDAGTRFPEQDVAAIMVQLLDGLQHAHEQGVWHRDIKPANLIVTSGGRLKIADFGIAKVDSSQLTETGVVMGSPGYMAPEQFLGGAVDWRADLFSAGVLMYQLLTGIRAFSGTTEQAAYKICHVSPPPPSVADPGRGWERYDAVVTRALAKDPEARYQTAEAFRAAIVAAHAAPVAAAVAARTIMLEAERASAPSGPSAPPTHGVSARTGGIDPSAPTVVSPAARTPKRRLLHAGYGVAGLAGVLAFAWLWRGEPDVVRTTTVVQAAAPTPGPAATGAAKPPAEASSRPGHPDPGTARTPPAAGVEPAAPSTPPRETRPATKPAGAAAEVPTGFWRDQVITTKVAGKLHFNRQLGQSGIEVQARDGVVTLRGSVPSQGLIAEAVKIAGGVAGVRSVRSELRVGPPARSAASGTLPP